MNDIHFFDVLPNSVLRHNAWKPTAFATKGNPESSYRQNWGVDRDWEPSVRIFWLIEQIKLRSGKCLLALWKLNISISES